MTPNDRSRREETRRRTPDPGRGRFSVPDSLVNNKTGWEFDAGCGAYRDSVSPHRPQRARTLIQTVARLMSMPRTNTPTRIAPARARGLRATYRQSPGQEGRSVLARRQRPGARSASWRRRPQPKGTRSASRRRRPYHGYYYRILSGPGIQRARRRCCNYVVKGEMTRRLRADRLPRRVRNSGVMTFMVNHAGTVSPEGPRATYREHRQAHLLRSIRIRPGRRSMRQAP